MKQTPAHRKRILRWRRLLCEFTDAIAIEKTRDVGLELLALDTAHIELGIAGLLRRLGKSSALEILQATLQDIDSSGRDAHHWRSVEAASKGPNGVMEAASSRAPPPVKQKHPLPGR